MQREDHQNQELLDISNQILQLTKEVRAFGDTIASESEQNKQLLDLSRQTLTITEQLQARVELCRLWLSGSKMYHVRTRRRCR